MSEEMGRAPSLDYLANGRLTEELSRLADTLDAQREDSDRYPDDHLWAPAPRLSKVVRDAAFEIDRLRKRVAEQRQLIRDAADAIGRPTQGWGTLSNDSSVDLRHPMNVGLLKRIHRAAAGLRTDERQATTEGRRATTETAEIGGQQ